MNSSSIGLRSAGWTCETESDISATITTRNETPLRVKHPIVPSVAIVTPASSGPKTRARLNWIELSAMAFGRSFLLMSDGIIAW